jgi:hypothetical protein
VPKRLQPLRFSVGVVTSDADYLKWAVAECISAVSRCEFDVAVKDFTAAMRRLDHIREVLRSAVNACSDTDAGHYSDGRRLTSAIELGDGTYWQYTWSPHRDHPCDMPRDVGEVVARDGVHKRVLISAPGHLEVVSDLPAAGGPRS